MNTARMTIPAGDAGVRSTVAKMIGLIRQGSATPIVRMSASDLVRHVQPRRYDTQIQVIRAWTASHIQFLRDPRGTELLHTPALMLQMIAQDGVARVDCDDAAILTGALGTAIGLRCRIVTVAFVDKRAPFSHTFTELSSPVGPPKWVEQDVTRSVQSIDPSLISRSYIVDV